MLRIATFAPVKDPDRSSATAAAAATASSSSPWRIVVLASGGGSNAERIAEHFAAGAVGRVVGVVSDRKLAGVHARAERLGIPSRFVGKRRRSEPGGLLAVLRGFGAEVIVLAGYLKLVPTDVLAGFPERVINIHPALLPDYGGAGMYGRHVHEAVAAAGDAYSGMTIHLADAHYDEGKVLFQARTPLPPGATAEEIAQRVLALEHRHYPRVLEAYLRALRGPTDRSS